MGRRGQKYMEALVTFIDVLGFKSMVASLSANDVFQILETLRVWAKPDRGQTSLRFVNFSDSIVRVLPLDAGERYGVLFDELLSIAYMQSTLAERSVALRGAVTVGDVAFVSRRGKGVQVFGPAFIDAYSLESRLADYPRVLVDPRLLRQQRRDDRLKAGWHTRKQDREEIDRLVRIDADGLAFVNYLDVAIHDIGGSESVRFVGQHRDFIEAKLRDRSTSRAAKRKYRWLGSYHNQVVGTFKDRHLRRLGVERADFVVRDQRGRAVAPRRASTPTDRSVALQKVRRIVR